jgi:hypothetical protein
MLGGAILMAAVAADACGDSRSTSTPTQPSAVAPSTVRIEDPSGSLRDHDATIRRLLDSTSQRVADVLTLSGVSIAVFADRSRSIEGYGIGGFTPGGTSVEIDIDPTFPGLAQVLSDRLPRPAAHELHHAKRWRGPGYGRTLLEALVSEGLADHFSIELMGGAVAPWSDGFPRDQTSHFLALARSEFDSATYDHQRWFFVTSATLPRWTGYTLGFRLIETYKADHPGATAAQLVNALANTFRP